MLPLCDFAAGRQAHVARSDKGAAFRAALDFAGDFRGVAQMIDEIGVLYGGLGRPERGFFDDRGVQRPPANVLALSDNAVLGP